MKTLKKNNKKNPEDKLCLPFGISNMPYMELHGNREAIVEGCSGILEYDIKVIRINTSGMIISFKGRGLKIKCITDSSLIVTGYITNIEFLN